MRDLPIKIIPVEYRIEGEYLVVKAHVPKMNKIEHYLRSKLNKVCELIIKLTTRNRSTEQNNSYWGVAVREVQEYIYNTQGVKPTKDEVHNVHIAKIIKPSIKSIESFIGETIVIYDVKTPSQLDAAPFAKFYGEVQDYWAVKTNGDLIISDPKKFINE